MGQTRGQARLQPRELRGPVAASARLSGATGFGLRS